MRNNSSERKKFLNPNVENWYKWIFRRQDNKRAATVYFLSRRNSTSGRFYSLYENSDAIRIVLIQGLRLPKTDWLILGLLQYFVRIWAFKFSRYPVFIDHGYRYGHRVIANKILHIDDPTYTESELIALKAHAKNQKVLGKNLKILVTSQDLKSHFEKSDESLDFGVLAQGFTMPKSMPFIKNEKFSCVYSAPYIQYFGDKFYTDLSWDASHLLDVLIPRILEEFSDIEIHLIGRLGRNAKNKVERLGTDRIISHGLVSPKMNSELLSGCHVGLYPRRVDQRRRVLKVYEYLGAKLPVVTYQLVDSSIVGECAVGEVVSSVDEYVRAIGDIRENYEYYVQNIEKAIRKGQIKSWQSLGHELDTFIERMIS